MRDKVPGVEIKTSDDILCCMLIKFLMPPLSVSVQHHTTVGLLLLNKIPRQGASTRLAKEGVKVQRASVHDMLRLYFPSGLVQFHQLSLRAKKEILNQN